MKSCVPEWLAPHVLHRRQFEYGGGVHEYVVFSVDLPRSAGAPEISVIGRNGVLGVSDAYPEAERYRELALVHELVCNPRDEDGCVEATKIELSQAELCGVDLAPYVAFRTSFFENLIHYYERWLVRNYYGPRENKEETRALLKRLRHSSNYLRSLDIKP